MAGKKYSTDKCLNDINYVTVCINDIEMELLMVNQVIMPKKGLTMEEGTILKWYKNEGDYIRKGEILVQIEADKAVLEIEAEYTGILKKISAKPGDVIPVTDTIAYIVDAEDKAKE